MKANRVIQYHIHNSVSKTTLITLLALLLSGCAYFEKEATPDVVVQVGDAVLTLDKLQSIVPDGATPEDSILLTNNYIAKWAREELLYAKAKKNIPDPQDIELMVEQYRKNLTIHQYQQAIINQRMTPPSDNEIEEFYNLHQKEYPLVEPIVKGILLKIPTNAPKQQEIISAMRKLDTRSIEKIEKYSTQYALGYDYFIDRWVSYNDLSKQMPLPASNKSDFIRGQKLYIVEDSIFNYMLSIAEYRLAGEMSPLENVKESIKNTLMNQKKILFIEEFANSMYEEALQKGQIKINTTQ